ncbi:unnamed protein product [Trichogramma brassicae]|uniref:Uncharacterized protein n=1 Tax=Trichogramma brassicae TaxID=86971 RepID=A0A6H5I781_9HYME|nr:unnamed protein product [Trichogramma brassicae]
MISVVEKINCRSLDCVEDGDEEEGGDDENTTTSILHVGPLRKKTDSTGKNRSVPSLVDAADQYQQQLSSASSLPMCPVHGSLRDVFSADTLPARSEPRIVIKPRLTENPTPTVNLQRDLLTVDEPDSPRRVVGDRAGTKLPRIIIKPTQSSAQQQLGTLPRPQRPAKSTTVLNRALNLQDNETYQRLLVARREKMPLPGELSTAGAGGAAGAILMRIPTTLRRTDERSEAASASASAGLQRVNMPDAAVTKL